MSNQLALHLSILDLKGWASDPEATTLLDVRINRQDILDLPRELTGVVEITAEVQSWRRFRFIRLQGNGWYRDIPEMGID